MLRKCSEEESNKHRLFDYLIGAPAFFNSPQRHLWICATWLGNFTLLTQAAQCTDLLWVGFHDWMHLGVSSMWKLNRLAKLAHLRGPSCCKFTVPDCYHGLPVFARTLLVLLSQLSIKEMTQLMACM